MHNTLIFMVLCFLHSLEARPEKIVNDRPIIGILDQESYGERAKLGETYIAASYVKWVEAAGGRVLPLQVLFPGGGQYMPGSSYYDAAKILYEMALAANDAGDYFPLWGHCLGFELLTVLSNKDRNLLEPTDAQNWPQPIIPKKDMLDSRMFQSVPREVWNPLITQNVTVNFHSYGLLPENFTKSGLDKFYKMLATNFDRKGKEFISIIEGIKYPFFGLQFHPEKNSFEINAVQATPHTPNAIVVAQYFANVFVNQARKSSHRFPNVTEEISSLIDNFHMIYTAPSGSTFAQIYAFNVTN